MRDNEAVVTDPDVSADRLALDLANTAAGGRDDLATPLRLGAWLERERHLFPPPDDDTGARLGRFLALRGAIRDLIAARVAGVDPPGAAVDALNEASASAPFYPVLDRDWEGDRRLVSSDATGAILAAIARSAMELLAGGAGERVRECAALGCGRFFVAARADRRWCSAACGNRSRVARHYARARDRDAGP
jgi:predicted RNA-binding Zn ribbon-like protein